MCILLTYSSENGRVGRPPTPSTAKSRRFSRLSRDLTFVGKVAVLPQDYRIFRIHILLNFEILYLEAYRFPNSEGLEGLKGVRRILRIFVYGGVRMEVEFKPKNMNSMKILHPKIWILHISYPKTWVKLCFSHKFDGKRLFLRYYRIESSKNDSC